MTIIRNFDTPLKLEDFIVRFSKAKKMFDTDVLRSFVAVADTGSFTRAGEMVGRTQSAVSMQIKKLEESLGKPLLVREKRTVSLTAEGQVLLDRARQILRLTHETIAALKEPELTGLIRLGVPDDYAEAWLPPLFRRLAESHPNVEFELTTQTSFMLVQMVQKGDLDIAIVTSGTGGKDTLLARTEPVLWVRARGSDVDLCQPVPVAVFGRECPFTKMTINHLERVGLTHRIAYSSYNYSGIVGGVLAGLAVSMLPISALKHGMEPVPVSSPIQPLTLQVSIAVEVRDDLPRHLISVRDQIVSILSQFQPEVELSPVRPIVA